MTDQDKSDNSNELHITDYARRSDMWRMGDISNNSDIATIEYIRALRRKAEEAHIARLRDELRKERETDIAGIDDNYDI